MQKSVKKKRRELRHDKNQVQSGALSMLNPKLVLLQALLIVTIGFLAYWPSVQGPFSGDDLFYLTNNTLLDDPARPWKAWFSPGSFIEYYPIEQTVQYFQWQSWKGVSFGYHVTNIVLHVISSLLVWRLFAKLNLSLAWFGGLLFAIHPMQVESVASISELKNTLSLPPFLLAMGCWIDYAENGKRRNYCLSLVFFVVAMLCKSSVAPFPVLLLLYGWWKNGRVRWRETIDTIPFFAVSLVLGLITIFSGYGYLQHTQTDLVENVQIGPLFSRLALVGLTTAFYFVSFIWPVQPLPDYPLWTVNPPAWWQLLPWFLFLVVAVTVYLKRKSWGRHVILGLGFFLLFLMPVLGFFGISFMQFTWVMDHFLYIPMIGFIGLMIAALDHFSRLMPGNLRPFLIAVLIALISLLAWKSYAYAAIFSNEEDRSAYLLAHNPGAWIAREQLGRYLLERGRADEAIAQLDQALQMAPTDATSHYLLALALAHENRMPEADSQFETAIKLRSNLASFYDGYGQVLLTKGRIAEAMAHIKTSLQLAPDNVKAHTNLANALMQQGDLAQAIDEYHRAIQIDPEFVPAHINLGVALLRANRKTEAITELEEAARLDPANSDLQAELQHLLR